MYKTYTSPRVIYSSLFYVLTIMLLIVSKPSFMFDDQVELKRFGVGEKKTIFSLGVFVIVLSILSFYIFCLIDLIFIK